MRSDRLLVFRGSAWTAELAKLPAGTDVSAAVRRRIPDVPGGDVFLDPAHPAWLACHPAPPTPATPPSFWPKLAALDLTPENLAELVATLDPDRQRQWLELATIHPPVFGDGSRAWKIRIQNALHARLGKSPLGPDGRPR